MVSPALASTCLPSSSNWILVIPPLPSNSSGKYLITEVSGFEAAWPSPQIEASRIAWLNSSSNSRFHTGRSISIAAFWVPTRHGVHWPQLSSSKKRIRLSAAPFTLS